VELDPVPSPAGPLTTIVYWFHVDVGDYAFYAMAEWPVTEDIQLESGKRRVTARRGRIIESYVLKNPTDSERTMMERDYERHREVLQGRGVPLELGDLRGFMMASQSTAA
jgi:hypothetical protein